MNSKRAELKAKARASIREAKPKPALVTLVLGAILIVLEVLYMRINGSWDAEVQMLTSMYQTGTYTYIEPAGTNSVFGYLLCFSLSLMSILLGVGYTIYCLRVSRGVKASFGDLFDSFGIFFRSVWMNILWSFVLLSWALIFAIPAGYMLYTTGEVMWYAIFLPLLLPELIAFYAYRQAYFLMLDNPTMSCAQCLRASSNVMRGHKWELFKLDLSFIGWILLCAVPFVCLWVFPYMNITFAAYYDARMADYLKQMAPPVQTPEPPQQPPEN